MFVHILHRLFKNCWTENYQHEYAIETSSIKHNFSIMIMIIHLYIYASKHYHYDVHMIYSSSVSSSINTCCKLSSMINHFYLAKYRSMYHNFVNYEISYLIIFVGNTYIQKHISTPNVIAVTLCFQKRFSEAKITIIIASTKCMH